jgi:hypothetical protein
VFAFAGLASFTFDPDKVSAVNRARAMMHGFEQRVRDGGALGRDKETGASATPEQKRDAMFRIADHLMSGTDQWKLVVAEAKADDPGLLAKAMLRGLAAHGIKDEAGLEALIVKTMASRSLDRVGALKLWQDTPEVKSAALAIKAERAAVATVKVSAADLMADLMKPADGAARF